LKIKYQESKCKMTKKESKKSFRTTDVLRGFVDSRSSVQLGHTPFDDGGQEWRRSSGCAFCRCNGRIRNGGIHALALVRKKLR
jgi:hypothetical protein